MSTIRCLLMSAALILASDSALRAKCANAKYTVKGEVLDDRGRPVSGVRVRIFFDNHETPVAPEAELPLTTAEGAYNTEIYYPTLKSYSRLFGHNCSHVIRTVEIAITAERYSPYRKRIKATKLVRSTGPLDYALSIPLAILISNPFEAQ